jgi:hypothetical protein
VALYAFDGTWNVRDTKDSVLRVQESQYGSDTTFRRETLETNVHRFTEFYGARNAEYLEGVGTRFAWLGRIVGGGFGAGGKRRIRRMYRSLCTRYYEGDTDIDIIGFSRGAAMALHFANILNTHGIRNPKGPRSWLRYDTMLGWSIGMPKATASDIKPRIRFLGLFDTVASFGLPIGRLRNRRTPRWQVEIIPGNVLRSFHAMALDEVRAVFELVRPVREAEQSRHYELWFRGVHSNIGGGYPDRGLADIALGWMMEMYLWTLDRERPEGAPIVVPVHFGEALRLMQPERPPDPDWRGTSLETLEPDADGELGRPASFKRQRWRALGARPAIHHTAFRRTKNLVLDHYSGNRALLRRIPANATPVYDPPFFYGNTPRQEAEQVAEEAFQHIPVRAADWLSLDGLPVVRSDGWLGSGHRREDVVNAQSRSAFVQVAAAWLLSGRRPVHELSLPKVVKDLEHQDIVLEADAAAWIVRVLLALEPYVPSLRANQPPPEPDGGPVDPWSTRTELLRR